MNELILAQIAAIAIAGPGLGALLSLGPASCLPQLGCPDPTTHEPVVLVRDLAASETVDFYSVPAGHTLRVTDLAVDLGLPPAFNGDVVLSLAGIFRYSTAMRKACCDEANPLALTQSHFETALVTPVSFESGDVLDATMTNGSGHFVIVGYLE